MAKILPPSLKEYSAIKSRVQKIQEFLVKKQQTLALAESCTGGFLSYCLTEFAGASDFFLGSIVSYSNEAKHRRLQISADLLKKKGAVNSEVCKLMSQSIIKNWGSHWALSVTGVAGPGKNSLDPPIGTVFFGLSGPYGDKVERILLGKKSRQDIRHQSAIFGLDFLCSGIIVSPKKRGG